MSNSKSTTKNNKDNILNSRKLYYKKKDIGIQQKVCYSGNTASSINIIREPAGKEVNEK